MYIIRYNNYTTIACDQGYPESRVVQRHHSRLHVRDYPGGKSLLLGISLLTTTPHAIISILIQYTIFLLFPIRSPSECTTTTTACPSTIWPSTLSSEKVCFSWRVSWPSATRSSLLRSCVARKSKYWPSFSLIIFVFVPALSWDHISDAIQGPKTFQCRDNLLYFVLHFTK